FIQFFEHLDRLFGVGQMIPPVIQAVGPAMQRLVQAFCHTLNVAEDAVRADGERRFDPGLNLIQGFHSRAVPPGRAGPEEFLRKLEQAVGNTVVRTAVSQRMARIVTTANALRTYHRSLSKQMMNESKYRLSGITHMNGTTAMSWQR